MRKRPLFAMLVGYCIMAICAVIIGVPNGPSIAYADGSQPEPPLNPGPPSGDSVWTATNPDVPDQGDTAVNIGPKQEVSLWYVAQLLVLGVI